MTPPPQKKLSTQKRQYLPSFYPVLRSTLGQKTRRRECCTAPIGPKETSRGITSTQHTAIPGRLILSGPSSFSYAGTFLSLWKQKSATLKANTACHSFLILHNGGATTVVEISGDGLYTSMQTVSSRVDNVRHNSVPLHILHVAKKTETNPVTRLLCCIQYTLAQKLAQFL